MRVQSLAQEHNTVPWPEGSDLDNAIGNPAE